LILMRKLIGKVIGPREQKTVIQENKDMEQDFFELYRQCKDHTMTSQERMYGLYQAVRYVVQKGIPGDFVECGVWKGGSAMLMALTLLKLGEFGRKIFLYDTYAGMSEPTDKDRTVVTGNLAMHQWKKKNQQNYNEWCFAPVEEVKNNMLFTGYPQEKLVFVKGKVEETIPKVLPAQIAILRLDTDWFESTKHELDHLYPLLQKGGVMITDDYGHWAGAKEAIDAYFKTNNIYMLLNRIDYTGRLGIKN